MKPDISPLEERLELGDLVALGPAPFPLPSADDRTTLTRQRLHRAKEIAYDHETGQLTGAAAADSAEVARILDLAAHVAARWLRERLPAYGAELVLLKTCWHPEEEATRQLRASARNDLLHVDAVRRAAGQRILRLGVNLHSTDDRVWSTSEPLASIFAEQHAKSVASPPKPWTRRTARRIAHWLRPLPAARSPYDDFMLAFAEHLKLSDEFQEKSSRKIHRFAPESAWLAMTDGLVHAELRGRFALDHVFLVPPHVWQRPERAPRQLIADLDPVPLPVAPIRPALVRRAG